MDLKDENRKMSDFKRNQKLRKEGDLSGLKKVTASFIQDVERLEMQILKAEDSDGDTQLDEMIKTLLMLDDFELEFQQMMLVRNSISVLY